MKYISSNELAIKWNMTNRNVRKYIAQGRIPGAILNGKTWMVPINTSKPQRIKKVALLDILQKEKSLKLSGGIYHKFQIELTYNSNHIEGSKLSKNETQYIYETNTIGLEKKSAKVDDIIETVNHFRCINYVIDNAKEKLTENYIKKLHYLLKSNTSDSNLDYFKVGDYKTRVNFVGEENTAHPKDVRRKMEKLLKDYNSSRKKTFEEIIDFHAKFEKIHPFQDGNGRVGRLIILKECLKHNIVPIIIDDEIKYFYYRGLSKYYSDKAYLIDTCLTGQDKVKKLLDYFEIKY